MLWIINYTVVPRLDCFLADKCFRNLPSIFYQPDLLSGIASQRLLDTESDYLRINAAAP